MKIRHKNKKHQMQSFDLNEELDYYGNPKTGKSRTGTRQWLMGITLAILACAALLLSPVFSIRDITVVGNSHFSQAEILEKAGISTGDNVFLVNKQKAKEALLADPYIKDVEIDRKLPKGLLITVTERVVQGYVPYMGSYLCIDEEGRVLDVAQSCTETLPVVYGLSFSNFTKGEILPVEDQEALRVMVLFNQLINKYQMLDMVVELDVSDPSDVYVRIRQVEVHLGSTNDSDQKVRILAQIIQTIPEEDRGTLDLSDLSKPIVFRYLT